MIANPPNTPFPCPAANFYHSAYNPKTNTNTCEATNNIALSIELMMLLWTPRGKDPHTFWGCNCSF